MNLDNLSDLGESIRQHDLLQPIVIRPMQHVYEVVAGNRRFAATKLIGLRKISCHVIDLSDREAYEVALVENVQQKTMNPIEDAIAFSRYVESYGWGGVTDLSKRIGRSQEFVTRRIQLLRLPQKIQDERSIIVTTYRDGFSGSTLIRILVRNVYMYQLMVSQPVISQGEHYTIMSDTPLQM
jgi:ParB family transcriptional regulator, chromosome partitioning protein